MIPISVDDIIQIKNVISLGFSLPGYRTPYYCDLGALTKKKSKPVSGLNSSCSGLAVGTSLLRGFFHLLASSLALSLAAKCYSSTYDQNVLVTFIAVPSTPLPPPIFSPAQNN